MTTPPKTNNTPTIHVLSFDKPSALTQRFSFHEMSTLHATKLIPKGTRIDSCKILAYTIENKYLDDRIVDGFTTVGDFNDFFAQNPGYYIHDCEIKMESEMMVWSHDDGEVTIQFPDNSHDQIVIFKIFESHGLDKTIIEILKNRPGHYLVIDKEGRVVGDYENFDEYLAHGQD